MIEKISKFVHEEMWCKWAKIMLDAESNISDERRNRWTECFIPYEELSEEMKEVDRQFARKILGIYEKNISNSITSCEELGIKHIWCTQYQMPRYCSICGKED